MAQEKKPTIRVPSDAKITNAEPPGWMRWISDNAEGIIEAAGMVAGGPGGVGKKVAMKAAPKVAKAATTAAPKVASKLKAVDWRTAPKEVFDEFIQFTQKQEPTGGVLGSTGEELVERLWAAFNKLR